MIGAPQGCCARHCTAESCVGSAPNPAVHCLLPGLRCITRKAAISHGLGVWQFSKDLLLCAREDKQQHISSVQMSQHHHFCLDRFSVCNSGPTLSSAVVRTRAAWLGPAAQHRQAVPPLASKVSAFLAQDTGALTGLPKTTGASSSYHISMSNKLCELLLPITAKLPVPVFH